MSYAEAFGAAQHFTQRTLDPSLSPKFRIDTTWSASLRNAKKDAAQRLSADFLHTDRLDGHCFMAVPLVSLSLIDYHIPHAVTVGDVRYSCGKNYLNATRDSLIGDIEVGFNPTLIDGEPSLSPANAHCWITLPNGTILDPTIAVHVDNLLGTAPTASPRFDVAIYDSRVPDQRIESHIPLLTGLTYHMKVVTGISHEYRIVDQFYDAYLDWARAYFSFMQNFNKSHSRKGAE